MSETVRSDSHRAPHAPRLYGDLMVLAAACLWSFGGVFVKVLTQSYGVDPRALACLRSAVAGLLLSWALPGVAHASRWRMIASGLTYTCIVGGFVLGTSGTTAANAIFLQYAYPLFVAAAAFFVFREPIGARTVLALALGMSGIALILICSWTPGERLGLMYGIGSAFAFAAFTLLQRAMKYGSPIGLSSLYNLTAAALLLPMAYGTFRISATAFALVAAMATFQLGIPYVLFIKGLRNVPATDAALITLIEPILNPISVWLVVGESPSRSTVAGGALILLALTVRFMGFRRR